MNGKCFLVAAFFAATATADAQCGIQVNGLPVQSKIVVKLRAQGPSGAQSGSAIYVGLDKEKAYFITAAHVVYPEDAGEAAKSAEIKFGDSPQWISALVFPEYKRNLDLAVVSIKVNALPTTLPRTAAGQAEIGTVHVVGNPAAGDSNVWTGSVQNTNAENGDIQHFTTNFDQSLAAGYSGGAVFDSYGHLVGMHTASVQGYGIALKVSEIIPQLQAWTVPVNNIDLNSQVLIAPDSGLPEPDWATISKENLLTANELDLARLGEGAFQCGRFEWSLKFLDRAKQVQKSRVWESDYPLYAADLIIQGKPQEGEDALQEMQNEMVRPNNFLSHPPPIAMTIGNLQKARSKVPVAYRDAFDSSIRKATAILQQICNGNTSRPCQVALGQSQLH